VSVLESAQRFGGGVLQEIPAHGSPTQRPFAHPFAHATFIEV
jgi:hypothetical protein